MQGSERKGDTQWRREREREDKGVKGMEGFQIPALFYLLCSLIKAANALRESGREEESL